MPIVGTLLTNWEIRSTGALLEEAGGPEHGGGGRHDEGGDADGEEGAEDLALLEAMSDPALMAS